ncbi:hypothetical protein E8E13_000990 [Curvularia kusanoi]|uniref:F-box domain-containing protein n=1 Tax=Curvularia kusanoi TaxID=90978 RepID=A0A9P4W529_CURKU|nr:hypothetical protein E8E13_000990 [Curvularia kusanoi]
MSESRLTSEQISSEETRLARLLPVEIWLQILEYDNSKHLWLSVRKVSRRHQTFVEKLFTTKYLRRLQIALSLPRRDAASSRLKWPGDPIPGSQLVMRYAGLSEDGSRLRVESPILVKDRSSERTVEELRDAGILPRQRLEEAPTNVNLSTHPMASLPVKLAVEVEWDEAQKRWAWYVDWRVLLSRLFVAKDRHGKRWPAKALSDGPQKSRWRRGREDG